MMPGRGVFAVVLLLLSCALGGAQAQACPDGYGATMDQVIALVGEVYSMQLEVDAAINTMVGSNLGLSAGQSIGQSLSLEVGSDFANTLVDTNPDAYADGILTPEELASDPDGQALMSALQAQLAENLGIDPSQIQIDGISTGGGGRRMLRSDAESLSVWAFCKTPTSCSVDVSW